MNDLVDLNLRIKTEPTEEPVTLDEIKAHLRVDFDDDDDVLGYYITSARQHAENYCQRAFITQIFNYRLDEFPWELKLPRPNLVSVSSIKYTDQNGDEQTLDISEYQVDIYSTVGRVKPTYSNTWPSTRIGDYNAVNVEYVAGYGDTADVPRAIKQAIMLLVGHLYENRESTAALTIKDVPMGYYSLLNQYRVFWSDE